MKPTPEQIDEALRFHLADCAAFREMVHRELAEAKTTREAMAADVKSLLAVMNHSKGFLRALAWSGVVGSALVGAGAWLFDHLGGVR